MYRKRQKTSSGFIPSMRFKSNPSYRKISTPRSFYTNKAKVVKRKGRGFIGNYYSMKKSKGVELKYFDNTQSFNAGTSGTITSMCAVTAGTGNNNRVGRQINLKTIKVQINTGGAGGATDYINRYIVFIDKQPNAGSPTPTDILTSSTTTAFTNLDNRDRFEILADKRLKWDAESYRNEKWNFYRKVNRVITYGATAVPTTNYVGLLVLTNNTTGTVPVVMSSRLRFLDC
jgi:hypothetical protein